MSIIRGAVSVEENTQKEIEKAIGDLFEDLLKKNKNLDDLIDGLLFSVTPDITSYNPASAYRKSKYYKEEQKLFCVKEAMFETSPLGMIRVMIFLKGDVNSPFFDSYLGRASNLKK